MSGYKRRLGVGEFEETGGSVAVRILEALSLDNAEFGSLYVGSRYQIDVFDLGDTYGAAGLALSKKVDFSGDSLVEPITVIRAGGSEPSMSNLFTWDPASPTFWNIKAMNQTTAVTAAYQCWVDKGATPHTLRLSGTSSSAEITAMSDILSAGQFLAVIYRTALDSITSITWEEV